VTAGRRLAALEAALSPTELVLRWLEEAHAFGDLESYVRSLLGESTPEGPLDRLAREAAQGARTSLRGKGSEVLDAAVRRALRETVFRFELVMRINVTVHELVEREGLIEAALSAHIALLTSERDERLGEAMYLEQLATRRDLVLGRVAELHAAQEARAAVEERYLAGHPALFPEAVAAWTEQLKATESLADVAVRLAELDGVPPAEPVDPDKASARVTELAGDLVEPAKSTALEKLGEGRQALTIATGWVRTKLEPHPVDTDAASAPEATTR
jgi:hypothetical protein